MRIRRFEPDDAALVASLWQYWFRGRTRNPDTGLVDLVRRIYFERPDDTPEIGSLVAEDDSGRLLGFLGVTTTPVIVDGQTRTLAGVFPSIRDPDAPHAVASFLLRKLLVGPQVLTFSDGGHVKYERIWETLGGHIAPTASLRWVKAFRPARSWAEGRYARSDLGGILAPVWRPIYDGGDWIARRSYPHWFRAPEGDYVGEPLTPEMLIEAVSHVHAGSRLRTAYTAPHLRWLLTEMAKIREQGTLEAQFVRAPDGSLAGWWISYFRRNQLSRVFALDGVDRHLGGVIDHLFAAAESRHVGALMGRLDPSLRRPFATRGVFTHNGGSLMMVHGRDRSLVDDALLGRLAFGRMEGENWYWWALRSRTVP